MFKLFPTEALAQLWVRRKLRNREFNYFVGFRSPNPRTPYGISYGWAGWAGERAYVKDIFPHVIH